MRIDRNRQSSRVAARRLGYLVWVVVLGVSAGVLIVARPWFFGIGLLNNGDNAPTLRNAERAFASGDLERTVEITRQLWQTSNDDTAVLILLVRTLVYRSYTDYDREIDRETALRITTAAIERYPADLDVQTAHAFTLQATGRSTEAARLIREVLRAQPDNTLARVILGLSLGGVGGYQNALRENQTTAATAETYLLDVRRAVAISLGDLGRYTEAINTVDAAIAINDKLPMLHFERALYALQIGDADGATSSYFRILAFDPDNIKARLRLCTLSSLLRESNTALRYCNEVTQAAPGWVDGWYQLGREYYLRGDFTQAQNALNRCTTLSVAQNIPIAERNLDCWYLQGQSAEVRGDCEGLLKVYNEFMAMVNEADLPQTWTYPPEGPIICQG